MNSDNSAFRAVLAFFLLLFSTTQIPIGNCAAKNSYRLNAGDQIKVVIFGHNDLSGEYQIDSAGEISLPLIKTIQAAGLTVLELENTIANKLKPDYLKNPKVSVLLAGQRPFYILGEIKSPGSYAYKPDTTVLKAVAIAGGYTYRARKKKIIITRASTGQKEKISDAANTPVHPGDVIEVPERFF